MVVGFAAMASVTGLALWLSLRHGPPIALLGMAEGFLTPALLSTGGGNALALFSYLYITAAGFLFVIRHTYWWWLSLPTIGACLLWVLIWLIFRYEPADSFVLFLFLIAISITTLFTAREPYQHSEKCFSITSILHYVALGGSFILMGAVAHQASFGLMEWALFGLLALGSMGLAFYHEKLYGFVPWISLAVNLVMFLTWESGHPFTTLITLLIFAAIYSIGSYALMLRSTRPALWAGLGSSSLLAYYLLGYETFYANAIVQAIPFFWGWIAILLAIGILSLVRTVDEHIHDTSQQNTIYAVCSVVIIAFISLASLIEMKATLLPAILAIEMAAIAWVYRLVSLPILRPMTAVIGSIIGLLLLPEAWLMLEWIICTITDSVMYHDPQMLTSPLIQLGIPAIGFFVTASLLRGEKETTLTRYYDATSTLLAAIAGYCIIRQLAHPDDSIFTTYTSFVERGIITNLFFIFGLFCLYVGQKKQRIALIYSGMALAIISFLRLFYFDMLLHNPLWDAQYIHGTFMFNTLVLPYGFTILWSYLLAEGLVNLHHKRLANYVEGFAMALLFMLVTTHVRYLFHGNMMHVGGTSNGEMYSYSVAWLALGIGSLFMGIHLKDTMLRYASLGLILFTTGKVFLYDASHLEGLYRVFSFLGLGVSLIGMSYLYTRYVFKGDEE